MDIRWIFYFPFNAWGNPIFDWLIDHLWVNGWLVVLEAWLFCNAIRDASQKTEYNNGKIRLVFLSLFIFILLSLIAWHSLIIYVIFTDGPRDVNTIIHITIANFLTFTLVAHYAARLLGPLISGGMLGVFLSKNWVRCIDYIYLVGSTFGITRIAMSNAEDHGDLLTVNAAGVMILSAAVALRLTKTSVEIFGWDKTLPPASSTGNGAPVK